MGGIDGQLPLALSRPQAVDMETIRRQPSMTRALQLCSDLGGFANDKDFCRSLDIDPAVWARIKSGQANFPHESYLELFERAGNEVPLIWLADRRGYLLTPKETELEARLRRQREENDRLQAENKLLRELVTGKQ